MSLTHSPSHSQEQQRKTEEHVTLFLGIALLHKSYISVESELETPALPLGICQNWGKRYGFLRLYYEIKINLHFAEKKVFYPLLIVTHTMKKADMSHVCRFTTILLYFILTIIL